MILHIRIHSNSWEFYGNSLQAPLPFLRECEARSQSSEAAQEQEAGRQDDTEAFSVGCVQDVGVNDVTRAPCFARKKHGLLNPIQP